MWRLVFSECGFDYETVFHKMTMDEIDEANAALDIHIKNQNDAIKRAKAKKK